ncbi:MAG: methylated-DNA--[protein]-cysteine S-methyltransferase [Deltaproteobacteria bacterium]|nr:methylated-DNA--[protein]-cysteine S-methyltransferase [Deltaproteobacteria bacterium]
MLERWPKIEVLDQFEFVLHGKLQAAARRRHATKEIHGFVVPTLRGKFGLGATAFGVALVFFPGFGLQEVADRGGRLKRSTWGVAGRQRAIEASMELMGYLRGQVDRLETPVDLTFATDFQRDIYSTLQEVPPGETITYGELASFAGHPGKARAVGTAMRNNPAPIFVPCHRVLPAAGGLGGWSGPKGWKAWLLRHEGATVPSQ